MEALNATLKQHELPLLSPDYTKHYVQAGLLVSVGIGLLFWRLMTLHSFIPGFEVYGVDKSVLSLSEAKKAFVKDAKNIMLQGAKKCKNGFQVVTTSGPKLVFPSSYINELKNVKELSLNGFVRTEFYPNYPGFEANKVTTESSVIVDTVRIKLTQSLSPVTIALCQETDLAVNEMYGNDKEWKEYVITKHANDFVARLSTRVFLGPVVCRDPAWLRIAVDYTLVVFGAARYLRMWPAFLQPVVHWFLPVCIYLRKLRSNARKIINQEIKRRNEERARRGGAVSKAEDSLGWMQEWSANHNQKIDLAGGQLSLTMAAIHTTSDLMTKVLYNLCAYPEYQNEIRKEIIDVLSTHGWSKTSLYNMKLLDSFMKETQRFTPASYSLINRFAEEKVTLKDGTVIPKGAPLAIVQDSFLDPNIYRDPESFDGRRFQTMRNNPGQENHWQFVTTSQEHSGFGAGMHACPGRFFASNEVKVAVCFLLLRYEWRRDSPPEMPPTFPYATELIANPEYKISYRRRKEEINILDLIADAK